MKSILLVGGVIAALFVRLSAGLAEDSAIAPAAEKTKPLVAGSAVPAVTLQDAAGRNVDLASLHKEGPVVLVFFRGGWCPICTTHTGALIKIYPEVKSLGARIVGISPDSTSSTKANVSKNSIPFEILSDSNVVAAKAFGLAFRLDDATLRKYAEFGIDLEKASGQPHHVLPIPAVFIVDQSGKIAFAHSNPDYRQRLDVKQIVHELKHLK